MATTKTQKVLTTAEIKYNQKVKSVELAIRSQGNRGMTSKTLMEVAKNIFDYIST